MVKNDTDETRNERAIAKLDEIWPFLEVIQTTPTQIYLNRATIQVVGILEEIRDILGK